MEIEFVGIKQLDEFEREIVNKLANRYYDKIKRTIKNTTSIILALKVHSKGGTKKKYSFKVKVVAPTRIFEASSSDWDLARTLHEVFNALQNEIKHKLHTDNQHNKK